MDQCAAAFERLPAGIRTTLSAVAVYLHELQQPCASVVLCLLHGTSLLLSLHDPRGCPTVRLTAFTRNQQLQQIGGGYGFPCHYPPRRWPGVMPPATHETPVDRCVYFAVPGMSILNRPLAAIFECPVCRQVICPEYYSCPQGHGICEQCRPHLSECPHRCPQTRARFTRNLTLEQAAGQYLRNACARRYREELAHCPFRLRNPSPDPVPVSPRNPSPDPADVDLRPPSVEIIQPVEISSKEVLSSGSELDFLPVARVVDGTPSRAFPA